MLNYSDILLQYIARRMIYPFHSFCDDFLPLVMLPLKQAWALFSCCYDCLTLVMLPLKQAWVLLLKLHEYLADVYYKLVIFQNIA